MPLQQALGLPHILLRMRRPGIMPGRMGQHHLTQGRPRASRSAWFLGSPSDGEAAPGSLGLAPYPKAVQPQEGLMVGALGRETIHFLAKLLQLQPLLRSCCLCSQAAFSPRLCWPRSLRALSPLRSLGVHRCQGLALSLQLLHPGQDDRQRSKPVPLLTNLPPSRPHGHSSRIPGVTVAGGRLRLVNPVVRSSVGQLCPGPLVGT